MKKGHSNKAIKRYFMIIRSKLVRFFDRSNLDKYNRMSTQEKLDDILKWKNVTLK